MESSNESAYMRSLTSTFAVCTQIYDNKGSFIHTDIPLAQYVVKV